MLFRSLPRKIGAARATRLMMTGESISAQDMERAGLVSRCVPAAALAETAQALTETLAAKSPLGLARMKELAALAVDCSHEEGLRREMEIVAAYADSYDLQEGLAAFAAKRPPEFVGR